MPAEIRRRWIAALAAVKVKVSHRASERITGRLGYADHRSRDRRHRTAP